MYRSVDKLPREIRSKYPKQACELYRAVYNRILEKNTPKAANDRNTRSVAEKAHEAALFAIRTEFEQGDDGTWHRAPIGRKMQTPGEHSDDK